MARVNWFCFFPPPFCSTYRMLFQIQFSINFKKMHLKAEMLILFCLIDSVEQAHKEKACFFTEMLWFRSTVHVGGPHPADCEFVEIVKPFFTFFLLKFFPTIWKPNGTVVELRNVTHMFWNLLQLNQQITIHHVLST